ncbi:MAG: class I mannose-6-phosphate isomerase [Clostridia bacterium]|nr:class I mannose-6-phosphate isomerase [Clostridia bacterium]
MKNDLRGRGSDVFSPFLLRPSAKDYIWGGQRINSLFGKNIPLSPLAETWECSVHPDGPSFAASGPFCGLSLSEIIAENPRFCGGLCPGGLPVLIKFIDAAESLSVQVHPDDDFARRYENGQSGKTECWFVIDAAPGASVVYGLKEPLAPAELERRSLDGSIEGILRRIPVAPGDVIPVPAGTLHAIGPGILLAEVQQNSNLTYRLYDWGRKVAGGKPRELHLLKASLVIREPGSIPLTGRGLPVPAGRQTVCLNRCFAVERIRTSAEDSFRVDRGTASWAALLCLDGSGTLRRDGSVLPLAAGDCAFIPSCRDAAFLEGEGVFLSVYTPPALSV